MRLCAAALIMVLAPVVAGDEPSCETLVPGPVRDAVLAWTAMEIDRPPDRIDFCGAVGFSGRVALSWVPWRGSGRFERRAEGTCWLQRDDEGIAPYSCTVRRSVRDEQSGAQFELGAHMDDLTLSDVLAAATATAEMPELSALGLVQWTWVEDGGQWDAERDGWRLRYREAGWMRVTQDCTPTPCVWEMRPDGSR